MFIFSHSKTAISFNILLVLQILCLRNINFQVSNTISYIYTINAVSFLSLMVWCYINYKRQYTDKTLTLRKCMYIHFQKELIRMQRLQNCAARLLTYTKKTMHITPVLHSLHWLPVQKRITFKILLLVYRALHKLAPSYLQDTLNVYKPSRNLRSSTTQTLQLPRIRHTWGERTFSHVGPKLWNSLPMSLRHTSSLHEFKSNLKTYLFNLSQQ